MFKRFAEATRIDLAGVAKHEWTAGELPPPMAAALHAQATAQAAMPPFSVDFDQETAIQRIALTASVPASKALKPPAKGASAIESRLSLLPVSTGGSAVTQSERFTAAPISEGEEAASPPPRGFVTM